jgi:hypothetical protein
MLYVYVDGQFMNAFSGQDAMEDARELALETLDAWARFGGTVCIAEVKAEDDATVVWRQMR